MTHPHPRTSRTSPDVAPASRLARTRATAPLEPVRTPRARPIAFDFASLPLHAPQSRALDTGVAPGSTGLRLAPRSLGPPRDRYEHDADRIADELVRGPVPSVTAGTDSVGGGGGRPLAAQDRAYFEPRLGADLGAVRIHSGASASNSASALHALAYTAGNDIVFGRERYRPTTRAARRLLAHELVHVVQQRATPALRATIQRAPADDAVIDRLDAAPTIDASSIASLASRAGTATGLRAILAADPALAEQIPAYFATGVNDSALNALLAKAFSPAAQPSTRSAGHVQQGGTNTAAQTPAALADHKDLAKGRMTWTLTDLASNPPSVEFTIDFKPDTSKVEARNISFGQAVISRIGKQRAYAGGTAKDPALKKGTYAPFEERKSKRRIDHAATTENDPFYGAEWDQATMTWKKETSTVAVGYSKMSGSPGGASFGVATMDDSPDAPEAQQGIGDVDDEFETVAMVLETSQPLGALKWGYRVKDAPAAPVELTGATTADCSDTPSASWSATMDRFYVAKYAEILDDFKIASAELTPRHKDKLDHIVKTLAFNATLTAQLGGAADDTDIGTFASASALSLARAQAAHDYLVDQGIPATQLELQSYGADWARVQAEPGKSNGKNRRVQIWLH